LCILLFHQVLAPLINDALLSDVTIVVGGESFYAHRVLLASWSPVFRSMLTGPFSEAQSKTIELHDIEVLVARSILDRAFTSVIVDRLVIFAQSPLSMFCIPHTGLALSPAIAVHVHGAK
jgi:hypothetical protein